MTAYIGYDNLLTRGAVSVSSEQYGFEGANCYNWLTYDYWRAANAGTAYVTIDMGENVNADYWAFAVHDLGTNSGTITPQYSSDNFNIDINTFGAAYSPTSNRVHMAKVTERYVRYFRFKIESASTPSYFGSLAIGKAVALPREIQAPFVSPKHGRKNRVLNNISESGQFLGRSLVYGGTEFDIRQEAVPQSWLDEYWDSLISHIEIYPFYFLWDATNRVDEAVFAWTIDVDPPSYSYPTLLNFGVGCKGLTS